MFSCKYCSTSFNVTEGDNVCPNCKAIFTLRGYQSNSPIFLLPKEITDSTKITDITILLQSIFKTEEELKSYLMINRDANGQMITAGALYTKLICLAKHFIGYHNKWSVYREELIQWYEIKTTQ